MTINALNSGATTRHRSHRDGNTSPRSHRTPKTLCGDRYQPRVGACGTT
jgi:hypothetical protein